MKSVKCQHVYVLQVGTGPLGVCGQCGKLVPILPKTTDSISQAARTSPKGK